MMRKDCSQPLNSLLVDAFAARTEGAEARPYAAMAQHVCQLRSAVGGSTMSTSLYRCLPVRRIWNIRLDPEASGEGCIQPMGSTYEKGFTMLLSKSAPSTRMLFTVAHEICHTFFYEMVPEIKFLPHQTDEAEERLCNFGAAELLMPASHIRKLASRQKPSLSALRSIAQHYRVSLEASLVRLRTLKLWDCALSLWYRGSDGVFRMDRIFGDLGDWAWVDDRALTRAWESHGAADVSGRTTLSRKDATRGWFSRFVYFQARRVRDSVMVLWGKYPMGDSCDQYGLFGSVKRRSRTQITKEMGRPLQTHLA